MFVAKIIKLITKITKLSEDRKQQLKLEYVGFKICHILE